MSIINDGLPNSPTLKHALVVRLYKLQRVSDQGSLFEDDPITKEMIKVINNLVVRDYKNKTFLKFRHPVTGQLYVRHYKIEPCENFAIIHIGESTDDGIVDYATVCFNLSCENYVPYVLILDHHVLFEDHNLAAKMVEDAINWAFKNSRDKVRLVEWNDDEVKFLWAIDCVMAYKFGKKIIPINPIMKLGHENLGRLLKKFTKSAVKVFGSRKPNSFSSYIALASTEEKAALIYDIGEMIHGSTEAIDIMRPVCFGINRELISDKVPYKAFIKQYPQMEDLISRQSFDRYKRERHTHYPETDPLIKAVAKRFESIL